ncbi:MAG: peptidoglycan-binding protein [Rothia sp. (in: high G+C Gram-positive bacteria)]|uniref:peptidoglycan-binding protein n=1 Tax=Rothia sp. (in: high G+C Gram-positive bacteria) TaxID=1885016 RepID=UPI0026DDBCB4|nr:peptidoglycan-binding protein [Rothia sp. (in: high G+C Gram-positive bacteria)]MDO4885012.1 peptidoglycan-binding protein [Rothia sp. (in: high G+C Gram-positive bacteria)]
MTNEHTGFSRRKLLKAGAVGVPTAGLLAFGSTLVTAAPANAISADGWWGSETSAGFQRFMNTVMGANLVVDGVISSQDAAMQTWCPGIVGGWEWVPYYQATGSPTITYMHKWLGNKATNGKFSPTDIAALQKHYGVSVDGSLDGPSQTIKALQNEINQWVG